MSDDAPPPPNAYLYVQLSDMKADLAAAKATLISINEEIHANRDRFHKINDNLQSIVLQLNPLYKAYPEMDKQIRDFNDLKNKGYGILIAASAGGAIMVEIGRFIVKFLTGSHN